MIDVELIAEFIYYSTNRHILCDMRTCRLDLNVVKNANYICVLWIMCIPRLKYEI